MDADMSKTLTMVIGSIEKDYGKGTIIRLTDQAVFDPDNIISSGSISLDAALGIGGYRKGRIVEIYGSEAGGKTTLCLHAVANAQKQGKVCAYIDMEHALDPTYMKNLGVDLESLLVSQPSYGEQALQIADKLAKSGAVNLVVIDSVAALIPQKELEGDMGDHHIGAQARMMSQAMRKLAGTVSQTECVMIFVNQIRHKIGVMFGCFHYDARVLLANGTTEKIGKIVNQKMEVEVLSKSKDGKIEPKRIIDWHNNGKANRFYNLVVDYPHGNGRANLPVGDNHQIFTPKGEIPASELKIGDDVLVKTKTYLSKEQEELAIGTFLGDGSIRINDAKNTASLRLGHGQAQYTYLQYKTRFLGDGFMNNFYKTGSSGYGCDSHYTNELVWLNKYKQCGALKFVDDYLLNKISPLSIAIWYLDDGTFSGSYKNWGWGKSVIYATKIDQKSKEKIADRFVKLGMPRPSLTKQGFSFSGKKNKEFQEAIVRFIPVSMSYKAHPKLRYQCNTNFADSTACPNKQIKEILIPAKIVDIYDKPANRKTYKFDITVEGNHSYFIDNVLVHNSPETTTGGNALKFYASQRLDIRRIGTNKQGEKAVSNRTRVKVVKNKLAPPFRVAEFDIRFGIGIDKIAEILDLGVEDGVVNKSGAWYDYNGERLGQGKENVTQFLRDNPEMTERIKKQIIELRGLEDTIPTAPEDNENDSSDS